MAERDTLLTGVPRHLEKSLLSGFEIMELLGLRPGEKVGMALGIVQEIQDEYLDKGVTASKEDAAKELVSRFKIPQPGKLT